MINPANMATLTGRLTADPELRTTPSGVSYSHFTVAVDRGYAKPGEEKVADFIDCAAWRSSAEFLCKHFKKGDPIQLVGGIETRTYEDTDGKKRKKAEVSCESIKFVPGSKSSGGGNGSTPSAPASSDGVIDDSDEDGGDLPF